MKKMLLLGLTVALAAAAAVAQPQQKNQMQYTQARVLDVNSSAYVKPLKVSLQVDLSQGSKNGRIEYKRVLKREAFEKWFGGYIANVRSWIVFAACQEYNCDVIVAPTFNVQSAGDDYEVIMRGYPANFKNWAEVESTDDWWIRLKTNIDRTGGDKEKKESIKK